MRLLHIGVMTESRVTSTRFKTMKQLTVILLWTLLVSNTHARDEGYALQCTAVATGSKRIVSFLQDDVNKRARFIATASRTMWDEHEWQPNTLIIKDMLQLAEQKAVALSRITIDRATLVAQQTTQNGDSPPIALQCERWTPQTRNK